MQFILTEQIMNGTVTMDIVVTIIEAANFQTAIQKVKALPNFSNAVITVERENYFSYEMPNVLGHMKNEEVKII